MQIHPVQQDKSEFDKKTVNPAVKICISCGNTSVHIQNCRMFCKDCGSFFGVESEHE